jgi:hypothetical protein
VPAPVPLGISVDRSVIDVGQPHVVRVVGPAHAQEVLLFGATAPTPPSGRSGGSS